MFFFYAHRVAEGQVYLNLEDSKHCCKVLRKKVGDTINVIDGKGNLLKCEIADDNFKACIAQIKEIVTDFNVRPFSLTIAIAPTKNISRFEWFVEKAVEIGVECIIPIQTKRTERFKIKTERLDKIALSASKQSAKSKLSIIEGLTDFEKIVTQKDLPNQRFIAYVPEDGKQLFNAYNGGDAVVFIGPEGGFTDAEITLAKNNNVQAVSLGDFRLRTETAGIAACQIVATKAGL